MNTKETAAAPFEIAGGSVAGRAHAAAGRNNQDAFCWAVDADGLVAVVCDGCGSSPHSEVGAQVGARLFVQAATRLFRADLDPADLLEQVGQDVLARLRVLAREMSVDAASFARTVTDHFLFTIVGALITARGATTFSLGDGLVVINGERTELGPFPDNEPPYLGYALLPGAPDRGARAQVSFEIHRSLAAGEVQSLVLGSDGAVELESELWSDDRLFKNPDMVRRRLTVLKRAPRAGELSDDTTLVVIRRKAAEG
jgi:serine/threonine protein phosphatase PrpC